MPQLDTVTFLSQFFWLAFFFLGFYFALVQFFLPRMARLLKFRGQKMEQIKTQSAFALAEAQGHQQKRWENYGHSLALQKQLATQAAALQKEAVEETWENHLSLTTGPLLNQAYQAESAILKSLCFFKTQLSFISQPSLQTKHLELSLLRPFTMEYHHFFSRQTNVSF